MQGQRGEDYRRYTSDKSVSPVIGSDPSSGRPGYLSWYHFGDKKKRFCVCKSKDKAMKRQIPHDTRDPAHF